MRKIFTIFSAFLLFAVCSLQVCSEDSQLSVSAKACILMEAKTGRVIYEKNSNKKVSMASTTKIMTTLLCLESGGLDEQFVVDSNAIKVEGSSMGLTEGDVVTKRALCYGMLLPSGNDAANATAIKLAGSYKAFAEMMNKRAAEIGMTRTCFVTPSGLEGEGHGSSAYDMALLTREALRNPDFSAICSQKKAKVVFGNPPYERWLVNSNKLLNMYEGVNGVKTGFTDEAGRCLVSSCSKNGVDLICVTLNAPSDWQDHINMYNYGYSKFKMKDLKYDDIINISVAGGEEENVNLKSEESLSIGTDGMSENRITYKISAPGFIYAPIKAGEEIGEVMYYYDENYIGSISLKAVNSIDYKEIKTNKKDKNIIDRIKSVLFNR